MIFTQLHIPGPSIIDLEKIEDHRGFFARIYCENEFKNYGIATKWVQMNQTLTKKKGSIRGLHFQRGPALEAKIVRCIHGAIYDVILDLRENSETYGKWAAVNLTAQNHRMLYIPAGFAHGFQTLEPNTELIYMHSEFYSPECEGGVLYVDPQINISWPLPVVDISQKDQNHPLLNQIKPISV